LAGARQIDETVDTGVHQRPQSLLRLRVARPGRVLTAEELAGGHPVAVEQRRITGILGCIHGSATFASSSSSSRVIGTILSMDRRSCGSTSQAPALRPESRGMKSCRRGVAT